MQVTQNEELRQKVLRVIATVESRGLFVHSRNLTIKFTGTNGKVKSKRIPLIAGACVINALVPRSAMLLVGGHGGGKTTLVKLLGRMMTGKRIHDIEAGILRGHPQLTEEKMVATLRPGPLMKDGIEEVVWRAFVKDFWKIIDEVNRLTPHAQNILLSMLAEGELKYYDEVMRCEEYCLYATLNPTDAGTFEMAPPFLDRFGIAVPITMPTVTDLQLILSTRDERLFGYDELWQVPAILNEEEVLTIWNLADKVPVSDEASEYLRSLIREFGACIRTDKSQSRTLTPQNGLCDGCHFNTKKSICNKVLTPLSVRAAKDLNRYSKAVAWLLGATEVSIEIIQSLAPLVFWHRIEYISDEIEGRPFYGDKYEYTTHLVKMATARFAQRRPVLDLIHRLEHGDATAEDVAEIKEMAKSDLLVSLDYIAFAKELNKKHYVRMVKEIERSISKKDVAALTKVQETLLRETDFPNRSMLLRRVSEELHRLTLSRFTVSFEQWTDLWSNISIHFPKMTAILKETLEPPKRKVIRTEDLTLVIYVTGDSPDSAVFIEVSGGSSAVIVRKEVESFIKS